jgi:hypothetical protein
VVECGVRCVSTCRNAGYGETGEAGNTKSFQANSPESRENDDAAERKDKRTKSSENSRTEVEGADDNGKQARQIKRSEVGVGQRRAESHDANDDHERSNDHNRFDDDVWLNNRFHHISEPGRWLEANQPDRRKAFNQTEPSEQGGVEAAQGY